MYMPFKVVKTKDGFKLFNLKKEEYAKPSFKSKATAISSGKNYISYREKRNSKLVGNRIIPTNKKRY